MAEEMTNHRRRVRSPTPRSARRHAAGPSACARMLPSARGARAPFRRREPPSAVGDPRSRARFDPYDEQHERLSALAAQLDEQGYRTSRTEFLHPLLRLNYRATPSGRADSSVAGAG